MSSTQKKPKDKNTEPKIVRDNTLNNSSKLFGFIEIKSQPWGSSSSNHSAEFAIGTPTNFHQKTHVDTNWNWSGEDISSQFSLREKLGSGSYGTVYSCVHNSSEMVLASKVIPLAKQDSVDIMKEVEVLKTCNHPNIVRYFGSCANNGSLWILMDLCSGGSLIDVIQKCPNYRLNEEQLGCVLNSVLEGLLYLHSKRIIHRDLKAGNILISEKGDVKIADFGVSAKINNKLSATKTVIGTPLYMAPEMFEESNYDYKADIWSLGITTMELAQGKPPRHEVPAIQIILLISSGEIPTFKEPSEHSDNLKDFISNCLQIDPKNRKDSTTLLNHSFIQSCIFKNQKSIIQELCSPTKIFTPELNQSSGSSPLSSSVDGVGQSILLLDDNRLLDDRLPESNEELKLLVLQLRHKLKTQQQQQIIQVENKKKGNEEIAIQAKKALSELENWKKYTKRLEDELKDIIKKDKKLRENP